MDDFEIELKHDFLQEARELLQNTEQSFLELEKDPSNKTLIDAIFRFAHNLKGTSRAVGFGQIAELTHRAENLLLEIKQEKIFATDLIVSTLLLFNDKVREMIDGLEENLDAVFDCEQLMKDLDAIIAGEAAAPVATPAAASFEPEVEVEVEAKSVESFEEPQVETVAQAVVHKLPEKKEVKKEPRKDDETLRVSLNRLEVLNNLVGELVIIQSVVESALGKSGELKTARSLGKLCKDIQDLSMSLRMVPVGPSFQKLARIVRDTSKLLNKKVDLRLIGEDTEIDKTVAESLGDPLVHIIRNAIDHGLETPAERIAAGKPEEGVVEVMAFHEGNFLVIQITDDGKGINGSKLIEKARAKGIIPDSMNLTEQQAIELIFHAGFSTKEVVSEVSGRGVGMDVVKTNIEQLGGEVKVRSKLGSGSCFRLMLPLTLAIIDGMLIKAGGQQLVVPKGQVQEVIRLEENMITQMTGRRPYMNLRNTIIPVFYLEEDWGSVATGEKANIAMIVRHNDQSFAIGITDIMRQQQVVVKPPTKEILNKQGVMGTTILGDGKPSLIIDLINLYSRKLRQEMNNDSMVQAA
ncbi:MAG: chemotaxis protein CheA [Bacteriovoracaceae bacterium]|nr:chemotaxis protein CheA [Bacteriovoracaceae bacterium]